MQLTEAYRPRTFDDVIGQDKIIVDSGGGAWSRSMPTTGIPGGSQTVTIFGDDGAGAVPIASFNLIVQATQQTVVLDFGPAQINLNGNGVFSVRIVSTPNFSVLSIDLVTLRLAGAAPVHVNFSDVNGDGVVDLTLQFRWSDFVDEYAASLLDDLADGRLDSNHQQVHLALSGRTYGGLDIIAVTDVDLFMTGQSLLKLLHSLGY